MLQSIGERLEALLDNAEMLAMDDFSHTICLVQRLKRDDIFSSHVVGLITPSVADKVREEFLLSITAKERISLFKND
ncbi:MAG TPA: hypothetical protein VGO47_14350 [Chlamydiales bacterium]|nr:hypothetical protein [Chlamydiales bacterium]